MMMVPLIICLLAGMALGQRFKVLILIPATSLALVVAIGAGLARADGIWSVIAMAVSVAIALQMGYLIGTGLQFIAARARTARLFGGAAAPLRRPAH